MVCMHDSDFGSADIAIVTPKIISFCYIKQYVQGQHVPEMFCIFWKQNHLRMVTAKREWGSESVSTNVTSDDGPQPQECLIGYFDL